MNLVLLSGGSGSRLWPLSNDIRSKQFIKFFKNGSDMESMIQRVYHQIRSVDKESKVVITTLKEQVATIQNQIGENIKICIEPCRKDTFPAIVLAVAYLYDIEKVMPDEPVVVCPVDPFVEEEYFETLKKAAALSVTGNTELTLVGIEPTYPSEKYGYIVPVLKQDVSPVKTFKEKPDIVVAKNYISQGALWNSGVFAFKLGYLLERAHQIIEFSDYYDLYNKYKNDYKIEEILSGEAPEKAVEKAKAAAFDERLSLLGMLLDKVMGEIRETMRLADCLKELRMPLKTLSGCTDLEKLTQMLEMQRKGREKLLKSLQAAGAISDAEQYKNKFILRFLEQAAKQVRVEAAADGAAGYELIKEKFQTEAAMLKGQTQEIGSRLHFLFAFVERAFEAGNEMLILVTELTVNEDSARFIASFGCPDYQRHNEELMLSERQNRFMDEIEKLEAE